MYYFISSYRQYTHYLSYLFFAVMVMSSREVVAADTTLSLTRKQLERKLRIYKRTLARYNNRTTRYISNKLSEIGGNREEAGDNYEVTDEDEFFQNILWLYMQSQNAVQERIEELEQQIATYQAGAGSQGSAAVLGGQYSDIPFTFKVILGIVLAGLTSFIAIAIWEVIPAQKRSKQSRDNFPRPLNVKKNKKES